MSFPFPLRAILRLAAIVLPLGAAVAAPTIEGLPVNGVGNVTPSVAVAKALILPVSAYDDSNPGVQQSIKATSSNPDVFVRVRTGNPLLQMHISHTGTPAYEGDAVFQLFDDLTPQAAGFVAGFAEKGFYNGTIFHRIADLNAGGTTGGAEFIFQGGDPDGTDPSVAGQGGPGFSYDNEPRPELMFAGRGQLALANSRLSSTLRGTNGSQFFITDVPIRFLDFNYTILGQMTHGWALLDSLKATPRSTGTDTNGNDLTDRPVTNVNLTTATVIPQYTGPDAAGKVHTYTDAILVITAIRPGTSTITVTAGSAVGTFTVTAAVDTINSPPFFVSTNEVMTKNERASVPFQVVDLERDYVGLNVDSTLLTDSAGNTTGSFVTATQPGTFAVKGNAKYPAEVGTGTAAYHGPLLPILIAEQWHPEYRPGYDAVPADLNDASGTLPNAAYDAPSVVVGVPPVTALPQTINGQPGVAITPVAAEFQDSNPAAQAANVSATINWGDGDATHVTAAATVHLSTAPGGYHLYEVSGTTTYAKPGVYRVVVTLTGTATGWTKEAVSTAIVSASPLTLTPLSIKTGGASLMRRPIATFTDSGTPAAAAAYTATVDWGDGTVAPAQIEATRTAGSFVVYGTHTFVDPETFTTTLRVHKAGSATTQDAVAWDRLIANGFTGRQHLPPFNQAHLSAELGAVTVDYGGGFTTSEPVKEIAGDVTGQSQTYLTLELDMRNSGNLLSHAGTLRLYLARGTTLHKTPVLNAQGAVVTPADIPLAFGPSLPDAQGKLQPQTEVTVRAMAPGQEVTYFFRKSSLGDYRLRLPANETGTGYNVIADLEYDDPLVKYEPIGLPTYGRIQGIVLSKTSLNTSETGGTPSTFTVSLDRKPTANVTIPLTGDTTEGTITPSSLTFTTTNWHTPQTVSVEGISDSALPPNNANTDWSAKTYTLALGAATSTDALYNGLIGPTVSVTNADRDSFIQVGASLGQNASAVVTTSPTLSLSTDPASSSNIATITLVMEHKPTSTVSVAVVASNPNAVAYVPSGSFGPSNPVLTFAPTDFVDSTGKATTTASKTFYIRAVAAANPTNPVTYTVAFQASSTDANFNGITPVPVAVTNQGTGTTTSSTSTSP